MLCLLGAEGTLGVVTRVALLTPPKPAVKNEIEIFIYFYYFFIFFKYNFALHK